MYAKPLDLDKDPKNYFLKALKGRMNNPDAQKIPTRFRLFHILGGERPSNRDCLLNFTYIC